MNEEFTVLQTQILKKYPALQISNEEMMLIIHLISFQQQGVRFPSFEKLKERMHLPNKTIYTMMEKLIERGLLAIKTEKNASNQMEEYYSLEPLAFKMQQLDQEKNNKNDKQTAGLLERDLFRLIEDEFGRQLSPIEYEQISEWVNKDQFDGQLIKAAVKEAVLNQVYNLRYIDTILLNWKKRGITQPTTSRRQQTSNKQLPPVSLEKWYKE